MAWTASGSSYDGGWPLPFYCDLPARASSTLYNELTLLETVKA